MHQRSSSQLTSKVLVTLRVLSGSRVTALASSVVVLVRRQLVLAPLGVPAKVVVPLLTALPPTSW
jgi:hypothetical protein